MQIKNTNDLTIKIRDLFFKSNHRNYVKLDNPVNFITYKLFIINAVSNFNEDCDISFLHTKYKAYVDIFTNLTITKGVRIFLNITDHLAIYSKSNTNIKFYLDRGWSYSESINKLKSRQDQLSIKKLISMYGSIAKAESKRDSIINKQNRSRNSNLRFKEHLQTAAFPNQVNFWKNKIDPDTGKLYDSLKIKTLVSTVRKDNAKISYNTKKQRNSFNSTFSLKYYLDKGLPIQSAITQLYNRQANNQLVKYIEKYGEINGQILFKKRQEKRLLTLSTKSDTEKLDILLRQTKPLKKYSNASYSIFNKLIVLLEHNNILGLTYFYGPTEWYIYDAALQKINFYDFFIKELNFIIEFNGIKYHPNPNTLTDYEWQNWRNPYNDKSADEQYKIDQYKLKLAQSNNLELYTIWETDNIVETYHTLLNRIIFKYGAIKKINKYVF